MESKQTLGHKVVPVEKDLGDGFIVRRSLPKVTQKMVGPFVFWDHMGPVTLEGKKEMFVRSHPHIGLATITYLFSGEILHRDSLGNEQFIRPGEVNWMTAGRGIVHSERASNCVVEAIQLWVALPKKHEDVAPSFIHCKSQDLPKPEVKGFDCSLIVGSAFGAESPIPVFSDIFYMLVVSKNDGWFSMDLAFGREGAIYVTHGKAVVGSGETSELVEVERAEMFVFKSGSKIEFKCEPGTSVMVFGGLEFSEKPYLSWNFVSHSKEKIADAELRWKNREFPDVINETEFIPLP